MTETAECPLCSTSFTRQTAEDARGAVTGHMAASTDEQHQGVGYQKAEQLLDLSDAEISEQTDEQSPEQGNDPPSEHSTEQSNSSEQRGPAFDAPDPDPDVQVDDDQDDVGADHNCPHCGEHFENADELVADGEPVRGQCSECEGAVVIRP